MAGAQSGTALLPLKLTVCRGDSHLPELEQQGLLAGDDMGGPWHALGKQVLDKLLGWMEGLEGRTTQPVLPITLPAVCCWRP